jgi:hypothetical protein
MERTSVTLDRPQFRLSIEGDSESIEKFFEGLSKIIGKNDTTHYAEARSKIEEFANTEVEDGTGAEEAPASTVVTVTPPESGMGGMFQQLFGSFMNGTGSVSTVTATAAVPDLFTVETIIGQGETPNKNMVTYNGTTKEIAEADYLQLHEFSSILRDYHKLPADSVSKMQKALENHKGSLQTLAESLNTQTTPESKELGTETISLVNRAVNLVFNPGSELKSMTMHLYVGGKLPPIVNTILIKSMGGTQPANSDPANSDPAGAPNAQAPSAPAEAPTAFPLVGTAANTSAIQDVMGNLPQMPDLNGILGIVGNALNGMGNSKPAAKAAGSVRGSPKNGGYKNRRGK